MCIAIISFLFFNLLIIMATPISEIYYSKIDFISCRPRYVSSKYVADDILDVDMLLFSHPVPAVIITGIV
jgi:hypothetical protein